MLVTSMNTNLKPTLIETAQDFHQMGWMVGTSGNLSARTSDNSFVITASGCPKDKLTIDDFVPIALNTHQNDVSFISTQFNSNKRPSAETNIHAAIYGLFPNTQACYHVHSVEANLVSHFVTSDTLPLPPLEMLKGMGILENNPQISIPVFVNYLDVSRIASEIVSYFKTNIPSVSALLIRDHGLTVWASSLEEANKYVEILDYIFRYMVAARKSGI